jgi:hypothetical protein
MYTNRDSVSKDAFEGNKAVSAERIHPKAHLNKKKPEIFNKRADGRLSSKPDVAIEKQIYSRDITAVAL